MLGSSMQLSPMQLSSVVAALVHVVVIWGISFGFPVAPPPPAMMEITLSQYRQVEDNPDADFLAQSSQSGSGTREEADLLRTRQLAEFYAPVSELAPKGQLEAQRFSLKKSRIIATSGHSSWQINREMSQRDAADTEGEAQAESRPPNELAALQAKLDVLQQSYAKLPRVSRVTALATRQSDYANYLFDWQERVELFGNRYYPEEARRKRWYGDVRLMVALRPDGKVDRIELLQGSGNPVLDRAAIRNVELAAPFQPFPLEIRENTDILEIIRTWQFRENRLTSKVDD